jgi:hypothetical protein
MAESKELLRWRRKQRRGAIMKKSTFLNIEHEAESRGLSKERATKESGAAYWRAAHSKFRKANK